MIERSTITIDPFFIHDSMQIKMNTSTKHEGGKVIEFDYEVYLKSEEFEKPMRIPKKNADLVNIMETVCIYYGITVKELLSRSRIAKFRLPRMVYCGIARAKTKHSFGEIGEMINRNHASVLNAISTLNQFEDQFSKHHEIWKDFIKLKSLFI